VTYVEDSTAPSAPSGLATDPAGPANDNNPRLKGSAEAGSTVRVYTTGDCSGTPVATGSAAGFASPGLAMSVADDSTTTFRATATDAAGNVSPCSSEVTYRESTPVPPAQAPPAESPGLLAGACANPMLGTNGADRLLATPVGDRVDGLRGDDGLYAFDGDDCVAGREGSDRLYGGRGDDVLRGDDGNDVLYGQEGDDTLSGGAGNDGLKGGDGTNRYFGRSGSDRIYARNGVAETVDCGSGRDVAVVDANDTVRGCERVIR
jgi:Ca2+-binding RTX toxin-like protein